MSLLIPFYDVITRYKSPKWFCLLQWSKLGSYTCIMRGDSYDEWLSRSERRTKYTSY